MLVVGDKKNSDLAIKLGGKLIQNDIVKFGNNVKYETKEGEVEIKKI